MRWSVRARSLGSESESVTIYGRRSVVLCCIVFKASESRPRLARRRSIAAMVAAVLVSIREPSGDRGVGAGCGIIGG